MYTEADMRQINARLRGNMLALCPIVIALLAVYVYALTARIEWLAMVAGPLAFVVACYGVLAHIWPNSRYRNFLRDMADGLSREVRGEIVAISDTPEPQDGAMVLPVRVRLDEVEGDHRPAPGSSVQSRRLDLEAADDSDSERIVYLNASKRDAMPGPGARVLLRCYGRHVREVERLD